MRNFRNLDSRVYLKTLKDDSMKHTLTDPPYLISKKSGFKSVGKKGIDRFAIDTEFGAWDCIDKEEHIKLLNETFEEVYRVSEDGGVLVCFYDIWKIETLRNILESIGFRMFRYLELLKKNPVPINSKIFYLSNAREVAIACVKGKNPIFKTKYHNGVFQEAIHRDDGRGIHPTPKSVSLMEKIINLHTNENDNVLDPFAGSGATLVAAIRLNRNAFGCELDKGYYKDALIRIKETERKRNGY